MATPEHHHETIATIGYSTCTIPVKLVPHPRCGIVPRDELCSLMGAAGAGGGEIGRGGRWQCDPLAIGVGRDDRGLGVAEHCEGREEAQQGVGCCVLALATLVNTRCQMTRVRIGGRHGSRYACAYACAATRLQPERALLWRRAVERGC